MSESDVADPVVAQLVPMTPMQFEVAMRSLFVKYDGDKEGGHIAADKVMCELLRSLGYSHGVDVFIAMGQSYS